MKTWQALLLGIFFGLLCCAVILLVSSPPKGTPVILLPTHTPGKITIDISGEVKSPGVYELPFNSRVNDALIAAGGLLPNGNTQVINLAAKINDGQKIFIPSIETKSESIPIESITQPSNIAPGGLININTADQASLETLPGIGPGKAADIITFRQNNGPFDTIEEIMKVTGIGPKTFEEIKIFITVDQ